MSQVSKNALQMSIFYYIYYSETCRQSIQEPIKKQTYLKCLWNFNIDFSFILCQMLKKGYLFYSKLIVLSDLFFLKLWLILARLKHQINFLNRCYKLVYYIVFYIIIF